MADDTEDVALNFGEEEEFTGRKTFRHPVAVACHLLFRILAIITYLFCGWFSKSFIVNFVFIVLFLSLDFWTVKNITGRLLVGLRWWNQIDEDGKSNWIFETRKGSARGLVTDAESRVFWLSMIVCQIFWIVFFFVTIFMLNFKWFMVVCVGLALNGANLYGYVRCKMGNRKKFSTIASNFLGQQVLKSMFTSAAQSDGSPSAPTS